MRPDGLPDLLDMDLSPRTEVMEVNQPEIKKKRGRPRGSVTKSRDENAIMKRQTSRTSTRKKVDRTVTKKCHKCSQECPVARKTCTCGYNFPTRTRNVQPRAVQVAAPKAEDPELTESKRRRFRTKRMRPDFFNPLDMEYSSRRKVKVPEVKKKRGRPKGSLNKPKEEKEQKSAPPMDEGNMFANLPSEKMLQFNIILQELNHKFVRQNFKPPE